MSQIISLNKYANHIFTKLNSGVLLTTHHKGKTNTMAISWGKFGIEWNKQIFCAYVRKSRLTHEMMESGEFTISIPMDDNVKKIIAYCGTKSGRDTDKIADLGLTTIRGQWVKSPAIKELPLTLECKIIFKQEQPASLIPADIQEAFYPLQEDGTYQDFHDMYYGEIVAAYIAE